MGSTRTNWVMGTKSTALFLALAAGAAVAQPIQTSIGFGGPIKVTNTQAGVTYISGGASTGGVGRWVLNGSTLTALDLGASGGAYMSADGLFQTGAQLNTGPQIFGNTAAGVSPAFRSDPTLIPSTTLPAATEVGGARWSAASNTWQRLGGLPINPALLVYGSSSSGSSSGGSFLTANGISSDGRFVVGLGYVCTYNNAGTTVSANSFRWRPWIWDAQGNGGAGQMTVLPTPFRTTSNTSLRRTGNAYAVSTDGTMVFGAQEHNTGVAPSLDPDGARYVTWKLDSGTGQYVMSFLDAGVDGSGFPKGISSTPSSGTMNAAGTIIAARGPDGITKWTYNGSTWSAPDVIGANLATPASWLPGSVTSCGQPPALGSIICMNDAGTIIAGSATYSTCGSFMQGGFIWTQAEGLIQDWHDYNVQLGTAGYSVGGIWGPIGDNGNPARGLCVSGNPVGISPDGNNIVGSQGGNQRIVGAPSWIWQATGGPSCVAPSITGNPAASTLYTACTSSIILNVAASGTGPISYQWFKDGSPVTDGVTASGSNITGASTFQMRINPPFSTADAGTYYAVATGQCGTPAQTTNAVVARDTAVAIAANDTCATPDTVILGTNVLGAGQSPCGAYVTDSNTNASCVSTGNKADRWYTFTPSTSGNYRFETCGSNFDTIISLWSGCNGSELACNNDYTTGPSTSCSSARSRIGSIQLSAGVPVLVRIAAPASAFLSSTSLMNLSISVAPAPAVNDTCDGALPAVVGANAFSTVEATNDYIALCNTTASRDVWFSFVSPGYGTARFATCPGTTMNTVVSVFDACNGNELACNDDASISGCSSQSIISNYRVTPGSTSIIRVAGNSVSAFGAGQLNIEFSCIADFNLDGGVDGSDIEAFFTAWEAGNAAADVNVDGGVDGSDIQPFFVAWEAGGC